MAEIAQDALAAEFDIFMARAGVTIPADRRTAILATYADFRGQIALLHGHRTAAAEPSNVFRLHPHGDVS